MKVFILGFLSCSDRCYYVKTWLAGMISDIHFTQSKVLTPAQLTKLVNKLKYELLRNTNEIKTELA